VTENTDTKSAERVHDEALVKLWERSYTARERLSWAVDSAHHALGGKSRERRRPVAEMLAALAEDPDRYVYGHRHSAVAERLTTAVAEFEAVRKELADHERAYTGWSRFWLLVSSGHGHLHSSMNCSTCNKGESDSRFALYPELSGRSEAEAVALVGEVLCTVCYPSAPVEWTTGALRSKTEARSERDRARAEREAKRLEKALLPDGSPLVFMAGRWEERLTTLVAAKSWLTDGAEWNWDHPSYPAEARALVAEAVAAKLGTTPEAEIEAAEKRAAKRR